MTITTPPQETRTRRPRRPADEPAEPASRRVPAERSDDAAETRPAKTDAARSGVTKTAARTRTAAPAERRRRRPATRPPAAKPKTKPAKTAAKPKTTESTTATKAGKVRVTVVRRPAAPPRAPFVLLVVGLLGGTLVSLLLLNTVLAQDAFTLSELQRGNQQLSERKQALQEDINRENSPAVLHAKARALGMVDGKRPAFIDARTGRVTEGGTRPPGVSDDAMAAAAAAGVTGAPGAIMPPAGTAPPRTPQRATATPRQQPPNGGTGGGTR
jgi:hypothetical protein